LARRAVSSRMKDYRRLRVWQKSHSLCLAVLAAMPRRTRANTSLIGQIIRSAESIPFNIVEGRQADTDAEFARFLGVSVKSAGELRYQLEQGVDRGIFRLELLDDFAPRISEVDVLLGSFIRTLHTDNERSEDKDPRVRKPRPNGKKPRANKKPRRDEEG
jgi:four helix bundle protein